MRKTKPNRVSIIFGSLLLIALVGYVARQRVSSAHEAAYASAPPYVWVQVTSRAPFPESYNFPLFNVRNQLWAFHSEGVWYSDDGKNWLKSTLPPLGLNTAYQKYIQFNDSVYALGTMEGNYQRLKLGSRIARTRDFKTWEVVSETSELPARVFYAATVFDGKIWLMGGFDGKTYYNDVWNSSDGVKWRKVADRCPWQPRSNASAVVFNGRLWIFGGGIIDGQTFQDVWHSADGITWERATEQMADRPVFGFSPVVYDGKIWLVGINRNNIFTSAMLVSSDGVTWAEQDAPWTPRGGVATCVFDGKLFMTGGKYSVTENGEIRFIYRNDVWHMARAGDSIDRRAAAQ